MFEDSKIFFVASLLKASGSFFVYSLFDSHPGLLTFPFPIVRLTNLLVDFQSLKPDDYINLLKRDRKIFDTLADTKSKSWDIGLDSLGPNRDEGISIDEARFFAVLRPLLLEGPKSRQHWVCATVYSYNVCLNSEYQSVRDFVFYAHDLHATIELNSIFPRSQFICVLRHPINVVDSINGLSRRKVLNLKAFRYRPPSYRWFLECLLQLQNIRKKTAALVLEELHHNPERSLHALCNKLGIPFHSILLRSTCAGKLWWGTSYVNSTGIQGLDAKAHREVRVNSLGMNASSFVMNAFLALNLDTGYDKNGANRKASVLGLMVDRPLVNYLFSLPKVFGIHIKKLPRRVHINFIIKQALTLAGLPFTRAKDLVIYVRYLSKIKRVDTSEIVVVNPLDPGSMRINLYNSKD